MKYYKTTTKYNCGIDLHTRQMYICVMDLDGNILVHRNIKHNDLGFSLELVKPYTAPCPCSIARLKSLIIPCSTFSCIMLDSVLFKMHQLQRFSG